MTTDAQRPADPRFALDAAAHETWLAEQTESLLRFAEPALDPAGGFFWLDDAGAPDPAEGKQLWINGRYTYCAAIGHLLGIPGQAERVKHGLAYLREGPLRDQDHGGWYSTVDGVSPDPTSAAPTAKESYGTSFVLLAAAAARIAGFDADDLFDDAHATLDRFWDPDTEMYADTFDRDFTALDPYRGQNPNMHLVEAHLLEHEADGERRHLDRALAIAQRLIRDAAAAHEWRLPEHYRPDWTPDPAYGLDDPDSHFRPYGTTVGHWLEWARLLVQLDAANAQSGAGREPWIAPASRNLFARAVGDAWDEKRGGFAFSTDFSGRVLNDHRLHWVITEAIGAATALFRVTGEVEYADWYARFWDYAATHHIEADGSWIHELDADGRRAAGTWSGKPDLYHALQATLFARVPATASIAHGLSTGGSMGERRLSTD